MLKFENNYEKVLRKSKRFVSLGYNKTKQLKLRQMKNAECYYSGCKCEGKHHIQNNWADRRDYWLCEKHAPLWVQDGLKESTAVPMAGIKMSWYKLLN